VKRRLLLNLTSLEADDLKGVRDTLHSLLPDAGRKARMEMRRSCLRISPHEGGDAIDVEYDMLPRGMRGRAGVRMRRSELDGLPERMAESMLDPSTTWFDRRSEDEGAWIARWDGWTDLQLVATALVPDFLDRIPAATDGTPWTTAECLPQFDGDGPVLPHELVEHVFSAHPHVISFRREDDAGASFRSWTISKDQALGFDVIEPDPMRTMRLLAGIPPHLLAGLRS